MLRLIAPITLLVLALAAPATDAKRLDVKHAAARLKACSEQAETATFRGGMRAWGKGGTLQMRFTLQSRLESESQWTEGVQPAGFGAWLTAKPGVRHFLVDKTVTKLAEGVAYRSVVRFRWRDASGAIVDRGTERTRACNQRDHRANLVVDSVESIEGSRPGTRLYVVRVANDGDTAAPVFSTILEVNGQLLPEQATTEPLLEGDWTELDFEGPPCSPGTSLIARTDTAGSVDESDEADNGLTVPCPAA
jgi:hypothetical protein